MSFFRFCKSIIYFCQDLTRHLDSLTNLNSSGSIEKISSNPPAFLSSVKCFSIIVAPYDIAEIAAPIPAVWSSIPISILNLLLKSKIVLMLLSSILAGYELVHCKKAKLLNFLFFKNLYKILFLYVVAPKR